MRSKYTKPVITFQNVALSSGIATGCQFSANFQFGSCHIMIPEWGETIYANDNNDCDVGFEDYPCYDVPTASSNIWQS